jgi:two-component system, sensor histidine kinase ChiS
VIDTGIGIPEKALNHIFDRFEQAENDTDKQYGGTGLGLDISKQLVEMHGGTLKVESVVGQGSKFIFSLPVLTGEQSQPVRTIQDDTMAVRQLPALESLETYTILLVEDETSMRAMMRRALESAEHVVVDLPDGEQVLETAVGLLPDLIVLDVRLPNVDGWQLLKQLKENVETRSIPVIICTVNEDEQQAKELGAEVYLRKPFSSDELLACIHELLPNSLEAGSGD